MSQHGCPERLSNRSKGFQEDAPSQPTMEVLVETLTGTAFEMTVSPSDTILAIKSKIFRVEGIPVSQQHILYNMKELDDSSSLRSLGITDGARLRLVLGMRVGPISTRRLPPPASQEPWRDIERLLDGNRDESEWCNSNGCRVTVVVLRDGGRINLLLRQNSDGKYSPLDSENKYSSSLTLVDQELDGDVAESVHDNEVTMGKMIDLRRRMDNLAVRKRRDSRDGKPEIQKTRSEETLSVPSLLDDSAVFAPGTYAPYSSSFAPLLDSYTRYDRETARDPYTLQTATDWSAAPNLPPIGTRTDSAPAQEASSLSSSALSRARRARRRGDHAILELDDDPALAANTLAPIPAAELRPLVWLGWRSPLSSAVSLHAWPATSAACRHAASTDDLDHLKRNSRMLPALSRHRNRSHLHLSDEGLDLRPVGCERRRRAEARHHHDTSDSMNNSRNDLNHNAHTLPDLSDTFIHNDFKAVGGFQTDFNADFNDLNTIQVCRNDVEAERNVEADRLFNFDDYDVKEDLKKTQSETLQKEATPPPAAPPARRPRCTWCRKRLSIATEHRCRCGAPFCAPHRYAEVHGCAYDYRALDNTPAPRLQPSKLPKI